jgi:hypothetical protein
VVSRPSTPTGPRAWMRPVLMPTSAPRPSRNPSAKRVLALWNTHALSCGGMPPLRVRAS